MDAIELMEYTINKTAFSRGFMDMLHDHVEKLGNATGVITITSTADFNGKSVGEPHNARAVIENGKFSSSNGPAIVIDDIVALKDGGVAPAKTILFMRGGLPYRNTKEGPAVVTSAGDSLWWGADGFHRKEGPAGIVDGQLVFALEDVILTADEFGEETRLGKFSVDWTVDVETMLVTTVQA